MPLFLKVRENTIFFSKSLEFKTLLRFVDFRQKGNHFFLSIPGFMFLVRHQQFIKNTYDSFDFHPVQR